jgi:hypothetical protein
LQGRRLGLTTWLPNEGLHRIYAEFQEDGDGDPAEEWGDEARVRELLRSFDLRVEKRVWLLEGDSAEDVWELMTSGAPPLKAFVESLDAERLAEFRAAMIEHWRGFERDGSVAEPRGYFLVLGQRR